MKDPSQDWTYDITDWRELATPVFLFSRAAAVRAFNRMRDMFPGRGRVFYAMKSNSKRPLIEVLAGSGCGFEVSSSYELDLLGKIGVSAERIIAGNSIMSRPEISKFHKYGVRLFAADSPGQIERLAEEAPAAGVYLRILTDGGADSVFTMDEKFGVDAGQAPWLFRLARQKRLKPAGLSFNVGSQATNPQAWADSLSQLVRLIDNLGIEGSKIRFVSLGGGFPCQYHGSQKSPSIEDISRHTKQAIAQLPDQTDVLLEPGRALSAPPFALLTSVIARTDRPNGTWLQLDAGAYNALLEAMPFQGSIRYRITCLRQRRNSRLQEYILTGPTCDSLDVIDRQAQLPADIGEGDRLLIHDTGAYSFALSTAFNGFPVPGIHIVE